MKSLKFLWLMVYIFHFSCKNNHYTMYDFAKVEKTDAHYHIYSDENVSLEQAKKDNFRLVAINTHSNGCQRVKEAHRWLKGLKKLFPLEFEYTATFCLDGWDEPNWPEKTILWIDSCIADGAIAVKVWKNIGMEFRDKDSALIMIDNPKFDPVFKHLSEKGIPLVGHLGEPKNCWLPIDQMTTKNDSGYFSRNPQYHMYLHPDFPTYEDQMSARNKMLEKNPNLVFIGCHLASLEWSVDELSVFLSNFPNASVDMAARMGQLFYQTRENRQKVIDFFIKYQDRLLYGTDIIDSGGNKESMQKRIHETWMRDWEYLVTDHEMTSQLINGNFNGLKLPRGVVNKIYSENAKKWYN